MTELLKTTVEHDGRQYVAIYDPSKAEQAMFHSVQVYRKRQDGSCGLRLMSHTNPGYSIWRKARTEFENAGLM